MRWKCAYVLLILVLWTFESANEYSIRAQYGISATSAPQIVPAAQTVLDKMRATYKNAAFY